MSRLRQVRERADDGQLLLLVLAYTVIAGLLVTIVVNLSKAYLHRRALVSAVDGAALTAANQPDLDRVYSGAGPLLPLSAEQARRAVEQYAHDADLQGRFAGFEIVDVSTDGQTVTVTFGIVVEMPFVNLVTSGIGPGYALDASARARSPLSD